MRKAIRLSLGAAASAFFAFCALSFVEAFRVPIYTDEVVWKAQQYRYLQDGFQSYYALIQCPSNFGHDVPWLLKPAALATSAYYGLTYDLFPPVAYRVIGHLCFLIGVGLFAWLLRALFARAEKPRAGWIGPVFMALLPTSLGIAPFVATMNRPEQELWLAALALSLIIVYRERSREIDDRWKLAGFVAFSALLLQAHPQGVFLFAIYAVAAACAFRRRAWAVGAIAGFAAFAGAHALFWTGRMGCRENPIAQAVLQIERLRWPSWPQFIDLLIANGRPSQFGEANAAGLAGFGEWTQSHWLVGYPLGREYATINLFLFYWILAATLASAALGAWIAGRALIRAARDGRPPSVESALLGAWLVTSIGYFLLVPNRNFYRSAILLQFAFAPLAISFAIARGRSGKVARLAGILLFASGWAISLASQEMLFERARDVFAGLGTEAYLPRQPHSFDALAFDSAKEPIREAARACGWDPNKSYRLLVSDELGHQAIRNSQNPLFNTYVTGWRFAGGDPIEMLKRVGSQGLFGDCRLFAELPEVHSVMRAKGNFCCAGFAQEDWLDRARKASPAGR